MADTSPRPRLRPGPTKTGRMTVRNRPVWQNPLTKEIYSEKTVTIPWGDGYTTVPSVDGQGNELSREELFPRIVNARDQLGKGGPVDFLTGEDLPVFDTEEDAVKYAMWRSNTMFDKEASAQGFQTEQYELEPEKEDPSFLYDTGSYIKNMAVALGALGLRKLGFNAYPTKNSFSEGGISMLPAVDDDRTPSRPRDTFNPLAFAKESWESAKENFRDAGVTEVDLDDPTLYNGYIRAVDYLKDSGLAGLDLIDAAAKAVIGTAGELVTRSDASQKRFQRDIYSMPEAFAGAAGARSVTQLDDALETAAASGVQAVEKAKDIGYSAYQKAPPVVGDIVGQTKSMLSGDTAFRETSDVGPQPLSAFGGAKASYAPNLKDYGGIESTFNLEADNSTLEDLSIDFDGDPTGSLVRLMDEVEKDPVKYQRTLNKIVAGGWTRGKDNLLRFEIDDSKSKVQPKNLTYHKRKELKNQIFSGHDYEAEGFMSPYDPAYTDSQEKMYSTLEDVLDHPDLFKHYPELKDMPVVVDTDIESGTLGYFDREIGLVAVAEKVANDPDFLRDTLLHEIQHAIQGIEDFTRGTGTFNTDVTRIAIAADNSPTIKRLVEEYDKELSIYQNQIDELGDEFVLDEGQELARKLLSFKFESLDDQQEVALLQFLEEPDLIQGQAKYAAENRAKLEELQAERSTFSYGSEGWQKADEKVKKFINTPSGGFIYNLHHFQKLRDLAEGGVSYTTTKNYTGRNLKVTESVMADEDRYTLPQRLNEVYELVPRDEKNRIKNGFLSDLDYSLKDIIQNDLDSPEKKKLFKEIVGIDPDKIPEKIHANMNEFFSVLGKEVPPKPINPIIGYAANDKFGSLTRASVIYSTKAGEAEARNVQTRKDFSAKERQEVTPEKTEDVPRKSQWTDEDLRRIEKGEDIFKDKNIFEKRYARGGMVDKQMQDLFAGSK